MSDQRAPGLPADDPDLDLEQTMPVPLATDRATDRPAPRVPDPGVAVADAATAGVPVADDEPTVARPVTRPVGRPGIEADGPTERLPGLPSSGLPVAGLPAAGLPDVGESTVRLPVPPVIAPVTPEAGTTAPTPAGREASSRSAEPGASAEPVSDETTLPWTTPVRPADDDRPVEGRAPDPEAGPDAGQARRPGSGAAAAGDGAAGDGAVGVPVDGPVLESEGGRRDDGEAARTPAEVETDAGGGAGAKPLVAPWKRLSSAGTLIWVLIALFGFTLVVQLRSNDTDQGLAATRQEDLVGILSDLEARETRLNGEIASLEESQRQLTSGVEGGQAALAEAARRANELGLLAGTLPGRGPGLEIKITAGNVPIKSSAILNTVQELRGAGGEVMQLAGADGTAVRVVASSAFVDADGGVVVDGVRLTGPYTLTVIGAPQTMDTALRIPGGVVASVSKDGGTVNPLQRKTVDVTAVREAKNLQYARPVS